MMDKIYKAKGDPWTYKVAEDGTVQAHDGDGDWKTLDKTERAAVNAQISAGTLKESGDEAGGESEMQSKSIMSGMNAADRLGLDDEKPAITDGSGMTEVEKYKKRSGASGEAAESAETDSLMAELDDTTEKSSAEGVEEDEDKDADEDSDVDKAYEYEDDDKYTKAARKAMKAES